MAHIGTGHGVVIFGGHENYRAVVADSLRRHGFVPMSVSDEEAALSVLEKPDPRNQAWPYVGAVALTPYAGARQLSGDGTTLSEIERASTAKRWQSLVAKPEVIATLNFGGPAEVISPVSDRVVVFDASTAHDIGAIMLEALRQPSTTSNTNNEGLAS